MKSSLNIPLFRITLPSPPFPQDMLFTQNLSPSDLAPPTAAYMLQCEHFAQYILFEMSKILGTRNALKADISRIDLYRKDIYCISQQALPAGLGLESTH